MNRVECAEKEVLGDLVQAGPVEAPADEPAFEREAIDVRVVPIGAEPFPLREPAQRLEDPAIRAALRVMPLVLPYLGLMVFGDLVPKVLLEVEVGRQFFRKLSSLLAKLKSSIPSGTSVPSTFAPSRGKR